MTSQSSKRSLDEVRELLRSIEDQSADGGATADEPAAFDRAPADPPLLADLVTRLASASPRATDVTDKPDIPQFLSPAAPTVPIELPKPSKPALAAASPLPIAPRVVVDRLSRERVDPQPSRRRGGLISLAAGFLGFGAAVAIWYTTIGSSDGSRSTTASHATPAPVVPSTTAKTPAVRPTAIVSADLPASERDSPVAEPPATPTAAFITPASANEPAPGRVVRAPTPETERGLPSLNASEPTASPTKPPPSANVARTSLRLPASIDLEVGEGRALPVSVEPADARSSGASIVILGLPSGATLNSGRMVQDGAWSVPIADVGSLRLSVNDKAVGRFELTFDLRSATSGLIATGRTNLQVAQRPVAAASVAISDPVRADESELLRILTEGRKQLAAGHIAAARLLFQRAADGGSGESARMLGDTWDPAKLFGMGVRGISGDIERAIHWYERADELGDPQAKARLLALGR